MLHCYTSYISPGLFVGVRHVTQVTQVTQELAFCQGGIGAASEGCGFGHRDDGGAHDIVGRVP